ncbi:MAG: MBL fold metallo-hydrolase [Acidobacteria bacterium]|nr:MBL fold metallo-hydrolase [Acidobacteriota bacterium]
MIETRNAPPFYKNGYLLACSETGQTALVDPGDEVEELLQAAEARGWSIQSILLTHAHIDHITGVGAAKQRYPVPIYLHRADLFLYEALPEQGEKFGVPVAEAPRVDFFFNDGDTVRWGNLEAEVIHTPGHTPGGVCLKIGNLLIAGDTLFAGSIGRTDLPGGNYAALMDSIKERLLVLPDETRVFSGHGPPTTIGEEKRSNPFMR